MNHKNALPGRRTCEPAARLITSGRSPKGQPTGSNARHDGRLPQQPMNRVGQTAPSARARSVQTARGATVPSFPLTARPKTVFDLVLLADRLGQVECPTGLEANEVFRSPRRSWRASARTFKIVITLEAASPIDFPHGRDVLFRCHRSRGSFFGVVARLFEAARLPMLDAPVSRRRLRLLGVPPAGNHAAAGLYPAAFAADVAR